MSSIKKNFFYSSILTVSGYIFPLITFPYVSRVLGVANIGICNFVDGIINYFIIFSALGFSLVGIREVAKYKGNREQLSTIYSSLLTFNIITTAVMVLLLLICIQVVPEFYEHKELFYVGVFKLVGNCFMVEWFFKGMEDFRYITMRSLLFKCLYVICVFLFIKEASDYPKFYILTTMMFVGNCIFNVFYARHFVSFRFRRLVIKPYVSSVFIIGFYTILTGMYTSFNVGFLGFVGGTVEVGYYTTATKLYTVIMAIFTAFTNVMLPKMSSLLATGKTDEFILLLRKSVNVLFSFAVPVVLIVELYASDIVYVIAGKGYEPSAVPMRILIPLILIIGYEQIIIIQGLMPLKKDRAVTINSAIGATSGLVLNLLLVPRLYSVGSALVWMVSEFLVLASAQRFIAKYIGFHFPFAEFFKSIAFYIPLAVVLLIVYFLPIDSLYGMIISSFITLIYFMVLHTCVLKDSVIGSSIKSVISRIR